MSWPEAFIGVPPPGWVPPATNPPAGPIYIELLGPPRGKGRPRASTINGHIRMHTDKATQTYEGMLRHHAGVAMAGRTPLEGPIRLDVLAEVPIPASWSGKRKREAAAGLIRPTARSAADLDNLIKSVDSLNQVVWGDDSQVVEIAARKIYSERPRLVLTIAPVDVSTSQFEGLRQRMTVARELEAAA